MSATPRWFGEADPAPAPPIRARAARRQAEAEGDPVPQLELRMAEAERPVPPSMPPAKVIAPAPSLSQVFRQPFGTWLLDEAERPGSLGELGKAAKGDRLFHRKGSADDVRKHFGLAGADGDAFEALDDAEREYDRQTS